MLLCADGRVVCLLERRAALRQMVQIFCSASSSLRLLSSSFAAGEHAMAATARWRAKHFGYRLFAAVTFFRRGVR